MTKFYTFNQNNSGGSFVYDEDRGITHFVIVEADNVDHAIYRATSIGIYFDGCDAGIDCDCCGDRWYPPHGDGTDRPEVYGQDIRKNGSYKGTYGTGWMDEGREVAIHPIDGDIEWYGQTK